MPAKKKTTTSSQKKSVSGGEKKQSKQLYRSEKERVVAGVAGGLAEYFDLDPILPRVLFVILTLANGAGLLTYLILWIILPKSSARGGVNDEVMRENVEEIKVKAEAAVGEVRSFAQKESGKVRNWLGWGLLALGVMLVLRRLGILAPGFWGPAVLIVLGLLILTR